MGDDMPVIKEAIFAIRGSDDTKAAWDSAQHNAQNGSQKISASLNALSGRGAFTKKSLDYVSEGARGFGSSATDTARQLGAFNEKTEKGRQLMTAFGGTLGGVAGQATYFAGTIGYVIGKFSIWELSIMAVIGGIAVLGTKMYEIATRDFKAIEEATKKYREETDKLTKSINDMYDAEVKRQRGLSELQLAREDAESERRKIMKHIETIQNKMLAEQSEASSQGYLTAEKWAKAVELKWNPQLQEARKQLVEIDQALKEITAMEEMPPDLVPISGGIGGIGGGIKKDELALSGDADAMVDAYNKELEAYKNLGMEYYKEIWYIAEAERERDEYRLQEQERVGQSTLDARARQYEKEQELALRNSQELIDIERDRVEEENEVKMRAMQDSIGLADQAYNIGMQLGDMFDIWGVNAAKSEEARAKAIAKRTATEAALAAGMEVAKAWAAFFEEDYASFAGHLMVAGMYTAMVGKALGAMAGGGAGGGASVGGGAASYSPEAVSRETAEDEAKQQTVINYYAPVLYSRDGDKYIASSVDRYRRQQTPGRERSTFQ